jgi:putative salt-induced outer membrane protein YdiY
MKIKSIQNSASLIALGVTCGTFCLNPNGWTAAAAPVAPEEPKKNPWEVSASAGLTLTRGNSETFMGTAQLLAARKWEKNEINSGADVAYGKTKNQSTGISEKNTESYKIFGQYNRLFSERFFGYARAEGLHDAVADVEYRFTLSPGAGYYFIKDEKMFLRADAGPGFIVEKLGSTTSSYLTLRASERFEWKFSKTAKMWEYVEVLPQVDNFNNTLINAEIGVEASMTSKLSLRVYLQETYDNEPAPNRKKADTRLVAGVTYKF